MTLPASQALMDTVVMITRKKSCDDFRACLIETLMSLLPTQEIAFLRCVATAGGRTLLQDAGARRFGDSWRHADTEALRWQSFSAFALHAVARLGQFDDHDSMTGEHIHFMPIIVERRPPEVLYFRCSGNQGDVTHMVQGFSQLYRNFLSLISEGERDALTGLLNRKTLETSIRRILETSLRNRNAKPLSPGQERRSSAGHYWMALIDIDHFKHINDEFGHLYGDEVLLLVAQIMQRSFRNEDLLFRYGGEEFVVVLSPTTKSRMQELFERFRKNVEEYAFPQLGRVTVSAGVVRFDSQKQPSSAVGDADRALYYAKDHGRNQVHCYEDLVAAGKLACRERAGNVEIF
jgi:diguanylate cyclase (GGDEF)-like protein